MKKCFMLRSVASVVAVTAVASLTSGTAIADSLNNSSLQSLYSNLSLQEQAAFSEIAEELHFESAVQLLENLLTNDYYYDPTNIYDLTGDERVRATDAQFILSFLHGTAQYSYEYNEMDGNSDSKIDISDAYAYLAYAGDVIAGYIEDECIITHTPNSYAPETLSFKKV